MKRHFYTGMLILFFSCFFTGKLVAAQEEDFPWEIFIPAITSAANSAKAPCSPENCTKDQWDDIFMRAITELDAEGLVINPQTIRTDIVVYLEIFDRMLSIVGLKEAEGQKLNATFAPKEVEGQKLNAAFAPYDDKIIYCGPGNSKTNPEPYKDRDPQKFEKCINTACWNHDNCYDTIDNLSETCYWDKTTKNCDDEFFSAYETCKSLNECGPDCEVAETIARNARDVDCVNNIIISWTEWCKERLACPDCTPKSVKDSCDAIGAECGTSQNGCGGTIDCGSCPDPSTPECGILNGIKNKCVPKCSIREGTCTMSEQSSGLTLTYWLQSPPPWGGAPIPYCKDDSGTLLTAVPGGLKTAEIIRNSDWNENWNGWLDSQVLTCGYDVPAGGILICAEGIDCGQECETIEGTCSVSEQSLGLKLKYLLRATPPYTGPDIPYCENNSGTLFTPTPYGLRNVDVTKGTWDENWNGWLDSQVLTCGYDVPAGGILIPVE